MAFLCHISRVFINPLMSGVMNGLGLDFIQSFDGGVLVQDLKEKVVKGIYLIVRIVEKINYMEGNICQIVNKVVAVVIFIGSRGYKNVSWPWCFCLLFPHAGLIKR